MSLLILWIRLLHISLNIFVEIDIIIRIIFRSLNTTIVSSRHVRKYFSESTTVFVLVFMLFLCFFQRLTGIQCYVQKSVEQWAEGGERVCTIYQSTGALAFCNRVDPFRNGKRTVSICSRTLTERISKASFAFPMCKSSKEYLLRDGNVAKRFWPKSDTVVLHLFTSRLYIGGTYCPIKGSLTRFVNTVSIRNVIFREHLIEFRERTGRADWKITKHIQGAITHFVRTVIKITIYQII